MSMSTGSVFVAMLPCRCVCIPGYKGDGLNCIEFNPCEDSLGRGGCHVNAWCSYYGGGVSNCTCMALYSGKFNYCFTEVYLKLRGRTSQHERRKLEINFCDTPKDRFKLQIFVKQVLL